MAGIVLDGNDYRKGALERLDDARILLRAGQFAGCASSAGRAVEGMMRAVIWHRDPDVRNGIKSLATGHDLRAMLTHIRNLGLLARPGVAKAEMEDQMQWVARLWFNNMRYASSKFVETRWYNLGEVRKGRTFKQAVEAFFTACDRFIKRCEVLCRR